MFSNLGKVRISVRMPREYQFAKDLYVCLRVYVPKTKPYLYSLLPKDKIIELICDLTLKGYEYVLYEFLSGYVDADGDIHYYYNVNTRRYCITLRITSRSLEILERLLKIVTSLNHTAHIFEDKKGKCPTFITYDVDLITKLNLQYPLKRERLEIIKKIGKTCIKRDEFEKFIKPKWPQHVKGGSTKWLIEHFPEILISRDKRKI